MLSVRGDSGRNLDYGAKGTGHNRGSILSINALDRHLDQYLIDIPIDTQSTLDRHLINSQSIVGQVSTNSYASIANWSTPDRLLSEMSIKCQPRC